MFVTAYEKEPYGERLVKRVMANSNHIIKYEYFSQQLLYEDQKIYCAYKFTMINNEVLYGTYLPNEDF